MADVSFLEPYKELLVSDDIISNADELDLVVLPLYDESDAKYYRNIIEGFCRMQEYTDFWKTMKVLCNQVFALTKKCDPTKEDILFPKDSLVFPSSLLDPMRSCMTPRFPNVRFKNLDGTASYVIQLTDLTTWGNAASQCNGAALVKNGVDTVPAPIFKIIDGKATHWRTGDYLPEYMTDALFLLDEARISVSTVEKESCGVDDLDSPLFVGGELHYRIVLTVNKLRSENRMFKESYGVACIGSFCLESSELIRPNTIVKMDDGVYVATLSPTDKDDLAHFQISLTTSSIALLRTVPVLSDAPSAGIDGKGIDIEILDSIPLNGSLYHMAIIAGSSAPRNILPSRKVDLKIALRPSKSVEPLPVKDFMIQDTISMFKHSDITEVLKYGCGHYMTPNYGAQLLRLPVECFFGTGMCATSQHIRLTVHVIALMLALISVIIMLVYIVRKLIAIRRLKAASRKQEADTGIVLRHSVTKTSRSALKRVVRESQRIHANHLDRKRMALKAAISNAGPMSLRDASAILDVFSLNNQ